MKKATLINTCIGDKQALWLSDCNKYILVSPPTDDIIQKIYKGNSKNWIIGYCVEKYNLTLDESTQLYETILQHLNGIEQENLNENTMHGLELDVFTVLFEHKKYYKSNNIVFCIEYETSQIEFLIHPKFAHLEIEPTSHFDHHFQLYKNGAEIILRINDEYIGSWSMEHEHYMTGKVSMQILQKIYNKEEDEWMAIFHAAGISNGKEGILFLGDSGNGKSTLSALLLSAGYDVLADDFLPVESESTQLCSFPSAISVKKYAIDLLSNSFPELKRAKEYVYPAFDKTVRYLSNPNSAKEEPKKVRCKALVFVKFKAEANLKFNPLAKDIAFQKLVPDSWISPIEANAEKFLNWFKHLPCYELTYSDNRQMLDTVQNIFDEKI